MERRSLSTPAALLASALVAGTPDFADAKPKGRAPDDGQTLEQLCAAMDMGEGPTTLREIVIVRTGTAATLKDVLSAVVEIPGRKSKEADQYVDVSCVYEAGAEAVTTKNGEAETLVLTPSARPRGLTRVVVGTGGTSCALSEKANDFKKPECKKDDGSKLDDKGSKSAFRRIMDILKGNPR